MVINCFLSCEISTRERVFLKPNLALKHDCLLPEALRSEFLKAKKVLEIPPL